LVLHLLAEWQSPVYELLEAIRRYTRVKEKRACPAHPIPAVLKRVRQEFAKFPLDTRDGVKVTQPDGWPLVRGSNTEPIIRIVAEAKTEDRAREMVNSILPIL